MPNLVNHSLDYANSKMSGWKSQIVTIGNGSTVIQQYPSAGSLVSSGDRIFLLTDGNQITMPDMTGWTRKDITAFWQLTGISIQTSGYGKVVSQNIEEGQAISKDSNIEVSLE